MYKSLPVVFLDRDGVINQQAATHEYITEWENFIILPGVYEALKLLNASGYKVFIVTNQRCVARKITSLEKVNDLHEKMLHDLAIHECHVDGIYICPHDVSDNCKCRKPAPGLLLQVQEYLEENFSCTVNKSLSWIIGDSQSDVEAGRSYGINTILITHNNEPAMKNLTAENILDAVNKILCITGDD